jgi:hypothetical protein
MSIFTIKRRDEQQPDPISMGQFIVFQVKPIIRDNDAKELFEFQTSQLYLDYKTSPAFQPDRYTRPLMTWDGALQQCALRAASANLVGFFVAIEGRSGPVQIEGYPAGVSYYSAERNEDDGYGCPAAPQTPLPPEAKDHRQIAIERALEVIRANPEARTPLVEQIAKILNASATIDDETANPALRKFLKDRGGLAQPTDVDYPLGGNAIARKN